MHASKGIAAGLLLMVAATAGAQTPAAPGPACNAAPRLACPDGNCPRETAGPDYLLDFPCDLKPGEKLVFVLLLHGAGSSPAWVRSYFPAMDYKEKYRLVIAVPRAARESRIWNAEADDRALQAVSERVFERFGHPNIRSFWLAGHSQGGITATRLVCSDYFRLRVDGLISLSGGRIGPTALAPDFFDPPPGGTAPGATAPPARAPGAVAAPPAPPTCDFSYVYAVGEHEIEALPTTSPWAAKYACAPRQSGAEVTDTRAGYVTGSGQPRNASYGRASGPGIAKVMVYPGCAGDRLVADVMRMEKGHTEGLEPAITEAIIGLMTAAPVRTSRGTINDTNTAKPGVR